MAAHQTPPSLGFSRQEYWSGFPFPSPIHACMLSRFSHGHLCATPWTAAHQAPLFTGFSRQEYWSGLPSRPVLSYSRLSDFWFFPQNLWYLLHHNLVFFLHWEVAKIRREHSEILTSRSSHQHSEALTSRFPPKYFFVLKCYLFLLIWMNSLYSWKD